MEQGQKETWKSIIRFVVCLLIALVWLCGRSFQIDNTLNHIASTNRELFVSILFVVAATFGLYLVVTYIASKMSKWGRYGNYTNKRNYVIEVLGVGLAWIPYMIAAYPGYMVVDSWYELEQYWGLETFTSHHPPFHILILGVCSKIGMWLKNGNMGIFLMTLIQMVCLWAVLSYMLYLMRKLRVPHWLYAITYAMILFSPIYTAYFTVVLKDNLYAAACLLLVIEQIYFVRFSNEFWSFKHWILWTVAVAGVYLLRNNGKFILIPVIIWCVVVTVRKIKKIRSLVFLVIPLLLAMGIQTAIVNAYHVEKGSIREALSLPFQQTARYTWEHGEEVTPDEAEAIDGVINYVLLPYIYKPHISDPVKYTYRQSASKDDLKKYFETWLRQFGKHPMTYVAATLNQNYYLIDPFVTDSLYFTTFLGVEESEQIAPKLGISNVEWNDPLERYVQIWTNFRFRIPLVRLLFNYGFYNIILIFLLIESMCQKRWNSVFVAMSLFITDLIIIAAPVIYGSSRYAFPILYALPLVVAYYLCDLQNKNT